MISQNAQDNCTSQLTAASPLGAFERAAIALVWLLLAVYLSVKEEQAKP